MKMREQLLLAKELISFTRAWVIIPIAIVVYAWVHYA